MRAEKCCFNSFLGHHEAQLARDLVSLFLARQLFNAPFGLLQGQKGSEAHAKEWGGKSVNIPA